MSWDSFEKAFEKRSAEAPAVWSNYLGFYSSWWGGFFREPSSMLLPLDDHGFHRGDGVFEAVRLQNGAYFVLRSHLERLGESAAALGIELPKSLDEIEKICVRLAQLAGEKNGLLRLFVTRGPGGFSPNPRDSVGPQIYMALTRLKLLPPEKYVNGCRAMLSSVPAKDVPWARVKSCNYLQNVMMKKECVEKGFDLSISVDLQGRLCEGSTENIAILTNAGEFVVPSFDYTLKGTTVRVAMDLARKRIGHDFKAVRLGDITADDLFDAREAAFIGTTLSVLPIASIQDRAIGDGRGGPFMRLLNEDLLRAMDSDPSVRTEI